MQQSARVTFYLFLFVLAGCAYSIFAGGDRLQFSLREAEEWHLGYQDFVPAPLGSSGGTWIDEYVRPGQTVEDWTELVTVMRTFRDILVSQKRFYQKLVDTREQNCPGSTRWNIIQENDDSILYEWWAKPCMGFDAQHEIAVIVDGRRDRFLFRYTNMTAEMEADKREQWIEILTASKVIVDPN